MLDRLVGLETEYAIRFDPDDPAVRPVDHALYMALVASLRQHVLTVHAGDMKEGVFLATGGAVWFEFVKLHGGHGLIEGSTPECRGARQVVQFQRGQDLLLATACQDVSAPGTLTLVKNDRDSRGNVYGAQENYELTLATGIGLVLWRTGLVVFLPLLFAAWLGYLLLCVALVLYFVVVGLTYFVLQIFLPVRWRGPVLRAVLGEGFAGDSMVESESGGVVPSWLEFLVTNTFRLISTPFAVALYLLVRLTAFTTVRRGLLPFLVTRPVVAGAGLVTPEGEFRLSDKADAINCRLGYNGMFWDRPVYSIGHLYKAVMFRGTSSPREFGRLFRPRHRLQVCLGDSNMAEEAEYLRVGTTMLVIDALEAGAIHSAPRFRRPIRTLRQVCGDLEFRNRYRIGRGRQMSALEVQRWYLDACRRYIESCADAPDEAYDLLRRWEETLDALARDPDELVGRLDWVTKRFLVRQAGDNAPPAVLRKIDIRYHELSSDGYFKQLETTELTQPVVTAEEIERAMRTAPPRTPAAIRSHYIREFAAGDVPFRVNWHTVTVGSGRSAKVIELTSPRER